MPKVFLVIFLNPILQVPPSGLDLAAEVEQRGFSIDNLPVRIHLIIEMIWWTGLAPWKFEFPFPGNRVSTWIPFSR